MRPVEIKQNPRFAACAMRLTSALAHFDNAWPQPLDAGLVFRVESKRRILGHPAMAGQVFGTKRYCS